MVVELVCVGTELLLGEIVNTNAAYLAEQCADLGMCMYYQSVVGDNKERLSGVIRQAMERSDVIILCGGLGPTQDDLTKETVAEVLGIPLIEDAHTKQCIREYMEQYVVSHPGHKITENNWKQAMVPEGAIVLDNKNGTAPGLIIESGEKTCILLPGPPHELIPLFSQQVAPYLKKKQPEVIYSRIIKVCGIGESMVEDTIKELIENQGNPTIATYAKIGEVHLRVTAKAATEAEAKKLVKPIVRELKLRFGVRIFTTEEEKTLESCVIDLLKDKGLKLTTVESCTGGALTARLVNVPGASAVIRQGLITYSNKAKRKLAMVKKSTLKYEGAVSEKTAKEMAKGGIVDAESDVSVSITGLAGPDGGTQEKPVGLVYIGCCCKGVTTVQEYHFKGDRNKIRQQAVSAGLSLLRECILEQYYS